MIPALTKTEKTKLAGIILGEISPSAVLFIILSRPQNTKELIALLGPFIQGDTLREKIAYAFTVTRTAFDSDARFREVAFGVLEKLRGITNDEGEPGDVAAKLRSAMVTPMFVYTDTDLVKKQAKSLRLAGYNSVSSLVDLQTGAGQRDYISKGRMATKLTPKSIENLEAVIAAGLVPVVITRNDWAVRTKSGYVPSVDGQPATQADFYSATRLRYEKQFLSSLSNFYSQIHIQLSLEPEHPDSADFAVQMAAHLRSGGFTNRIFINPYAASVASHEAARTTLTAMGVEWARSHHGASVPPDPVWNTDGDTELNGANVRARVQLMEYNKKDWMLWTKTLANCEGDFPSEYLNVGLNASAPGAPDPILPVGLTGKEGGFLWKPIGENSKKLRVLLPSAFTGHTDLKSCELWHNGSKTETLSSIGVGNGNREHFAGNKPGSGYPGGTQVRVKADGSTWVWTIPSPAGRGENLKAERVGGKVER